MTKKIEPEEIAKVLGAEIVGPVSTHSPLARGLETRKLSARIAREVMGFDLTPVRSDPEGGIVRLMIEPEPYSTNAQIALDVVKKMQTMGWRFSIKGTEKFVRVIFNKTVNGDVVTGKAQDKRFARAICEAALAAVDKANAKL